jgi:16S rRNA processing protein RimM
MTGAPVVIGWIGRPHGLGGEVRTRPTGATMPALRPGQSVEVHPTGGEPRRMVVTSRTGTAERPILSFEGVRTRDEALALAGATVAVEPDEVASLPDPDTFYVRDLLGCEVLVGARPAGTVAEVHAAPANDVLEVRGSDGDLLVPFTADAIVELDLASRRIVVRDDLLSG